jgi:electron transfer flavoprotein alpha subunit
MCLQLSSLVLAEQKAGALQPVTLNAVTVAKLLGGPVTVLVAGQHVGAAASAASKIEGVDKVGLAFSR